MIDKDVSRTFLLIVSTLFISIIVILNLNMLVLLAIAIIALSISLLLRINVKSMLKFVIFFQGFFTLSSVIAQIMVFDKIVYESLALSNIKMFIFVILSFIFAKYVTTTGLIKLFKRISVNAAVAIALAIKFMKFFPDTWSLAYRTYSVNYDPGSRFSRIKIVIISVKAFINLSLYSALQTAESLATRSTIIFGEEK